MSAAEGGRALRVALVIFGEYAVAQSLVEAGARLKGPTYVTQPLP